MHPTSFIGSASMVMLARSRMRVLGSAVKSLDKLKKPR
jgi:hypothetical protein